MVVILLEPFTQEQNGLAYLLSFQVISVSSLAQLVKNPPAMQETQET